MVFAGLLILPCAGTSLLPGNYHEHPEVAYTNYQNANSLGDPRCEVGRGDDNGQVCCPRACGKCDNDVSCSSRPGGAGHCCIANIIASGTSCESSAAPCIIEGRLCATGDCGTPATSTQGWSGGAKLGGWNIPSLSPQAPPQDQLADPAIPPDNSCSEWNQYTSELQWSYAGHTQEHVHPHSQKWSNHIPISSRQACGTVYPRQGDAQDGMFPPGQHGNQEADKMQQLYYNTDIQPWTYHYHGGGVGTRTEYGIAGVAQDSTSWKESFIGMRRETIGWPTATGTHNLYGVTSGLSSTADFSLPLDLSGTLNAEYKTYGGVRLSGDPSAHSRYPHSAVDQSVHGANSGFIVHSGMKDQCHDLNLRNSCETNCTHDSTNTLEYSSSAWNKIAPDTQCTPCSLAQQCAPSSPLHTWTTQTPMSISGGTESINNGVIGLNLYQSETNTVDSNGIPAPGIIRSGDH